MALVSMLAQTCFAVTSSSSKLPGTLSIIAFRCQVLYWQVQAGDGDGDTDVEADGATATSADMLAAHQSVCVTFLMERLRAVAGIAEAMQVCVMLTLTFLVRRQFPLVLNFHSWCCAAAACALLMLSQCSESDDLQRLRAVGCSRMLAQSASPPCHDRSVARRCRRERSHRHGLAIPYRSSRHLPLAQSP